MDGFGDTLILTYNHDLAVNQQIGVTLSRNAGKFKLTNGEGYLSALGIDRAIRPETEPDATDHTLGSVEIRGVPYGIKYEWLIELQQLTGSEAQAIEDMVLAQKISGKLIKLSDRIHHMAEPTPRTRPISATYTNPSPSPGFVYYYGDFLVWLRITGRGVFDCETKELSLRAIEFDKPLTP